MLCCFLTGCSAGGSALDWGSRGRRFKSCHSDHICANGSVVEHRLAKARAASSNLVSRFFNGVSPSGKATDSDSVIRRFKSCYPSFYRLSVSDSLFFICNANVLLPE